MTKTTTDDVQPNETMKTNVTKSLLSFIMNDPGSVVNILTCTILMRLWNDFFSSFLMVLSRTQFQVFISA